MSASEAQPSGSGQPKGEHNSNILSRILGSLKPPPPSTSGHRPGLGQRSLSSPFLAQSEPLRPTSTDARSQQLTQLDIPPGFALQKTQSNNSARSAQPNNTSPAASLSGSGSISKRFRPSFYRKSTTNLASQSTSQDSSRPASPSPKSSPRLGGPSPQLGESRGGSREREVDWFNRSNFVDGSELSPTNSISNFAAHRLGRRGSAVSQRTLLASASGPLASPPSVGLNPISEPFGSPNSHRQPNSIQDPSALVAQLLPPVLLLLTQLGPGHLFSPPYGPQNGDQQNAQHSNSHIAPDRVSLAPSIASTSSSATSHSSYPIPSSAHLAPSYTHELHASSTLSVPAVSAAAVWRLLRGIEWIGEVGQGKVGGASPNGEADEDESVFDFPAALQGAADILAASAATRGVELVIGQVGSGSAPSPVSTPSTVASAELGVDPPPKPQRDAETRELLVRGDERAWTVALVWIIYHILASTAKGSTVEVRFLAVVAPAPPSSSPARFGLDETTDSQDTVLPTRSNTQKWWTVSLEVVVTNAPAPVTSPYSLSTPPQPVLPQPPFDSAQSQSIFDLLSVKIGQPLAGENLTAWTIETLLPGPRPKIAPNEEDPSVLLGKRRASLESTVGQEPSINDLKRFADSALRGAKVSLHAGENSTFAKHLTTYLAGWGMDVTHVPLDGEDANAGTDSGWTKGRRENFGRFDSGFGGSGPSDSSPGSPFAGASSSDGLAGEKSNSSGGSNSSAEPAPTLLIIDDDVTTLRRLLLAFKAPPLHYAPTLMAKRPQLATRRTRSSPHVRQLHQIPAAAPGTVILHFASMTHYKTIKEVVADALANSKHPVLPDVLVIPKPAGPRRIITALWTALKKPAVDPSLPPIATSPTSPGVQYWTPRLSPALAKEQQEFDFNTHHSTSSGSEPSGGGSGQNAPVLQKARTPPATTFYNPSGMPISTAGLPPSPLGKISDDQASYFACVAEELDGTTPSEGMVIQSPDGRAAIFFQPRTRSSRSTSGKEKASSRAMERQPDVPEETSPAQSPELPSESKMAGTSSPVPSRPGPGPVAAPHAIGLGQPRRGSGSTASPSEILGPHALSGPNSNSSGNNLPLSTPALTLDSFILAAKSRQLSEDGENNSTPSATGEEPVGPTLRRPSGSSSPRAGLTSPISAGRRSSANTGPTSPVTGPAAASSHISAAQASAAVARQREAQATPASPRTAAERRTASTNSAGGKKRKTISRRSTLATVPPINVLIVEDNPINQTILSMFMKKKGIKYAVAKDGEEAVQKWKAGSFHLVLMDIQLPVKDGIEATREIREMERANNIGTLITTPTSDINSPTSPSVSSSLGHSGFLGRSGSVSSSTLSSPTSPMLLSMPVIIVALTASSLQADRVNALAAGCNDFLTKPVSLPWLQQKLLEWGSMAYLSGFSRFSPDSDKSSSAGASASKANAPGSNKAFTKGFNSQADRIAGQLHIDPRPNSRSNSPAGSDKSGARSVRSGSPTRAKAAATGASHPLSTSPLGGASPSSDPTNPTFNLTEPTPERTPLALDGPGVPPSKVPSVGPVQEELEEIDARLDSIQIDQNAKRPGPTPLAPTASVSALELEPTLQSVLADGQRLLDAGRSRANSSAADSFRLVMEESAKIPKDRSPTSPTRPGWDSRELRRSSSQGSARSTSSTGSVRQAGSPLAATVEVDSSPESSSPDSIGSP